MFFSLINKYVFSGRNSPALSDDGILDGAPPPPSRPAPPARPNVNPVASEDTGSKEVNLSVYNHIYSSVNSGNLCNSQTLSKH